MYRQYFGLAEAPFSIAPDPRYLYLSQRHQEALAHLLYGVGGDGGFVLLTGEVGAGKTTVCRCLLQQIPSSCDVAYIFNPKLTVEELLSTICVEFGIVYPPGNASIKVFVDCINTYLLEAHAKGRHTVLIIDEAQNLATDVLEQMRLLTNLETDQRKLLQIILLGQPELAAMLERPELRQLSQRIVARYHLGSLTKPEVAAYVRHRLEVSGAKRQIIPARLMGRLYRLSGGVPRVINVLCDRSLLGAYVEGKDSIDRATLAKAAREVFPRPITRSAKTSRALVMGLVLAASAALALAVYQKEQGEPRALAASASAAPTPPAKPGEGGTQAENGAVHGGAPNVIAPAKAEPALAETLAWPASQQRADSRALAHAALFRAWGAVYNDATDVCRQALLLGLRCRIARGGLNELRQLNRPAVLKMRDDRGQDFDAALTALDGRSATFAIGAQTTVVALTALAAQWSGQYTLLWRLPPDASEKTRPGDRGPAVAWLSQQLARVQHRAADASKDPVFDDGLLRQVKQFQLAQGLIPDGAVGPQTLMRLASAADATAPKLSSMPGEK